MKGSLAGKSRTACVVILVQSFITAQAVIRGALRGGRTEEARCRLDRQKKKKKEAKENVRSGESVLPCSCFENRTSGAATFRQRGI